MKANRKFKEEENAVSAVIGVILMVAITVAIAATVYVYVAGFGSDVEAPKGASFAAKVIGNNLKITYATGDDDIADNSSSGAIVFIDSGYYVDLATHGTDIDSDGNWDPGDFISLPVSGLATDPCPITVVISGTTVLDTQVNI